MYQAPEIEPTKDDYAISAETIPTQSKQIIQESRMRRTLKRQSKRNILFMGTGLMLIIATLLMYGQSIVINLSLLIDKTGNQQPQQKINNAITYVAPPVIDPIASATNSAKTTITGVTVAGIQDEIKLYVNNELVDVTHPKTGDTFSFDDVLLQEGENKIKAITVVKNKKSNDSNILRVTYLKNPPTLTIDQPNDGDSFSGPNSLTIKGKTDQNVRVTINGGLVITKDDGSFSYGFPLQSGENKIHIQAVDRAENKTEKEIKVTYSS